MTSIYLKMSHDDYFRMGFFYQQSGDLSAAAECYIRSIENGPSAEAHTFLGWVLGQMGELDAAIYECEKALHIDPLFGNALNDMGAYLLEKRQLQRAIFFLEKACKAKNYDSPHFPHYNLARAYVCKGMLIKACSELETSVRKNPNFSAAKDLLKRLQLQLQ